MPNTGRSKSKVERGSTAGDRRRQLIDKALNLIEERLDSAQLSASLADLVRLLQMAGELETAERSRVVAGWVDPVRQESADGEGGNGRNDGGPA